MNNEENIPAPPDGVGKTLRAGVGRLLSLCNNPLSVIGLFLVALGLLGLITLLMFAVVKENQNPYLDVVTHMVLPGVLVSGLLIVPIGAGWKHYWLLKHGAANVPRYVHIDLRDRATLGALLVFVAVTFLFVLPGLTVSAYEGYVYSESTEFCARVCHTVMEPQGTAHASSAHARVRCAECHIGEGAGWFVKSKLSGTRQVWAVWRDSFHRPIPPAITELRPARETCEECHWPDKFYGAQYREVAHYSPDQTNTRRISRMMVQTGGADESIGRVEGIHMHMLVAAAVEFVAIDEHLQEIPWVRYRRADGTATVYRSDGLPNDAPPPDGLRRTVDCMDCHNRGAHHFYPPEGAVDLMLEAGRIDATLPFIKREAVRVLTAGYTDRETGLGGIERGLQDFYRANYAQVWKTHGEALDRAIRAVQDVYRRSFFPAMNVDWRTYPENIGHMRSPGCFRCHDGLHVDAQGKAVISDCLVCHTFIRAVAGQPNVFQEGPFEHSMPLIHHEQLRCEQCHTGGTLLLCRDCHEALAGLRKWDDVGRLRREAP